MAASQGISKEMVKQALERGRLPAFSVAPTGAWAVLRGRSQQMPFLLTQTQQGTVGQIISHYIVLPADAMRAIGGNLNALKRLTQEPFKTFEKAGEKLKLIDLFDPGALSSAAQVDYILELMTLTRNRINEIEKMLGAVVNGVRLYITNAPPDADQRVAFIQGLLGLLPTSARFGVSFATHTLPDTQIDAQVRFFEGVPPPDVTVFDWAESTVSGHMVRDEYSRFVMSQLRLDAELVIQRNNAMAAIAGWRLNQGDDLAKSLGYAALRLKVDSSLRDNQPVNKEDVARILMEDPTLSDDLQVKYALHLLRLGLAMRDLSAAAPVAILLRGNDKLEKAVLSELNNELNAESSRFIYGTLIRWMNNALGPQGFRWVDLTHRATLTHLQRAAQSGDNETVNTVLRELQEAGITLQIDELTPKLIKLILPLSYQDAETAENLFLLGVRYLPNAGFHELMSIERFRNNLHPNLSRAWVFINGEGVADVNGEMLLKVAAEYGERWEANILIRLCEVAHRAGRYELIDRGVLRGLFNVANSAEGNEHTSRLRTIARAVETNALENLRHPGPRYLLQIYLALGDYETLGKGMLRQLKQLRWENEEAYLTMLTELFASTHIPLSRVKPMVDAVGGAGVRSAPLVVTMVSAAQGYRGENEVEPIIEQAVSELERNRELADLLPPRTIFNLLDHYTMRRDADGMRAVLNLIPSAIEQKGRDGIKLAAQVYRKSGWSKEAQAIGLDVLRAAVRVQSEANAVKTIGFFVKQFGKGIQSPLEVTYLVKRLIGTHDLAAYADSLSEVVAFLRQLVVIYADERRKPSAPALRDGLSTLPGAGGLTDEQRDQFLKGILQNGRYIVRLMRQYSAGRREEEAAHARRVVAGRVNPDSMLDVLRVMGGGLVNGRRLPLNIEPQELRYPLQEFSMGQMVNALEKMRDILHPLTSTLPLNQRPDLKPAMLIAEMRSFAGMMGDADTLRDIAQSWQHLVDLLVRMGDGSDSNAFKDGSGIAKKLDNGRQAPEGALELMRFIYGYYLNIT
ncbi:MAG: hypothetical protein EA396_10540 [Anaerolineaceae bacterium]|nr:MAG: hypothetical protein EA396_10540 [Anaerolineaceae bacterium]